ncbi:signal peptidase II [Flavobacteriaceae bacterium XHP0103]|uniref:signal peptidase II n=1 Tax=Marixanthotalea marina TaxID=2844359 RepID=UPI002989C85E|nr:signal peptidase II [Marixanthotalea marina]MBU3821959.1 signal peptidase II [Marixanthotalea marina]
MKLTKRTVFIFLIILITIAIDQITKVVVRNYIESGEIIPVIGNYFTLLNVENKGAFLGMGSELSPTLRLLFLLILPIVVLGFVLYHILKDKTLNRLSLFAFASIIGGGIANVYDRVVYGSVTDFFFIDLGGIFKTGIFNMADLSVTTGITILIILSFKKKPKAV